MGKDTYRMQTFLEQKENEVISFLFSAIIRVILIFPEILVSRCPADRNC